MTKTLCPLNSSSPFPSPSSPRQPPFYLMLCYFDDFSYLMKVKLQYLSCCDLRISLNMSSRFTSVVQMAEFYPFVKDEKHFIVCMYHNFFTNLCVNDGYLGYFHLLSILYNPAINTGLQVSLTSCVQYFCINTQKRNS